MIATQLSPNTLHFSHGNDLSSTCKFPCPVLAPCFCLLCSAHTSLSKFFSMSAVPVLLLQSLSIFSFIAGLSSNSMPQYRPSRINCHAPTQIAVPHLNFLTMSLMMWNGSGKIRLGGGTSYLEKNTPSRWRVTETTDSSKAHVLFPYTLNF